MVAKRIALAIVVVAVIGIITVKMNGRAPASPEGSVPAASGTKGGASRPAVVLVADGREADTDCGCGKIIRRVRDAKAKGVAVEELAPDSAEAGRRYGVTVVPTVVFLDSDGQVVARREGESEGTLAAISADLSKLEGAQR